jgi:hypothetical protein
MSFHYSPKIVTDWLVLCLDAANPKSIVSGSTTWIDMSRNSGIGTLVNGPTLNSINGGSIVFNGVNYANTGYTPPISNFTINVVYQCTNFGAWSGIWGCEVWNNGSGYLAYFNTSTSLVFSKGGGSAMSITADSTKLTNYTFTLASDGTAKIYVNGVLQQTSAIILATSVTKPIMLSTRYSNDGTGIADTRASIIPYFSVYNRVLSDSEIGSNYAATRGIYT